MVYASFAALHGGCCIQTSVCIALGDKVVIMNHIQYILSLFSWYKNNGACILSSAENSTSKHTAMQVNKMGEGGADIYIQVLILFFILFNIYTTKSYAKQQWTEKNLPPCWPLHVPLPPKKQINKHSVLMCLVPKHYWKGKKMGERCVLMSTEGEHTGWFPWLLAAHSWMTWWGDCEKRGQGDYVDGEDRQKSGGKEQ